MIYFLSVLKGEYIKIGYTAQCVEKRKAALQTGNPCEIEVVFTIDGTLKQEKEIHRSLKEVFERLKVFNNPVNEWYPGKNSIMKMFMCNVQNLGINYALRNIGSISHWDIAVEGDEVFTIKHLERALHKRGFSRKEARRLIWENKFKVMAGTHDDFFKEVINEMVQHKG